MSVLSHEKALLIMPTKRKNLGGWRKPLPFPVYEWGATTTLRQEYPGQVLGDVPTRDGPVMTAAPVHGSPDLVRVPRYLAELPDGGSRDNTSAGQEFHARFEGDLRGYQQQPCADLLTELDSGGMGALLVAPTGAGKGTMAAWLAAQVGRTACIVVPAGNLMNQMLDRVRDFTDIPSEHVCTWQGGKLPREDAKVVIAMLQTVYKGSAPQEIYDRFGLVVFDELHKVAAEKFSLAMGRFPARWRVAMSATPDRRDGRTALVEAHVGFRRFNVTVPSSGFDVYWIDTGWTPPDGTDYDPSKGGYVKNSLYSDIPRNAAIAGAAYRAHRAGRRVLVMCEHVRHAENIHASLRTFGVPENLALIYGGGHAKASEEAVYACPPGVIVVATKQKGGTGLDVPALDTCILGVPLYDATQEIGRVRRQLDGKPRPVVIDVRDSGSPALRRIGAARMNGFVSAGGVPKSPFK